mgnify:CR=1 FL=1
MQYIIEASKIIVDSENIHYEEVIVAIPEGISLESKSGFKIIKMDRVSNIIKKVIPDYDNTTIIQYSLKDMKMFGVIYSHDCPTGSSFEYCKY